MGNAVDSGCQTDLLHTFCTDKDCKRNGVDEVRTINLSITQNADTPLSQKCTYFCIARVFRRDSPLTRSRRSEGSGGESSRMLTSVEENAVQGKMLL
jgi:hypothetical protein